MPTINDLPPELLQYIVFAVAHTEPDTPAGTPTDAHTHKSNMRKESLKSLSLTNRALRGFALPGLWRNIHVAIAFDELPAAMNTLDNFMRSSHPARKYAEHLDLRIDGKRLSLSPTLLTSLDAGLTKLISGMKGLQSAYIQVQTLFEFPEIIHAVTERPELQSLMIASTGTLKFPAVQANKLTTLIIHSDVGSCIIDFSCFPNLRKLGISIEDNSISQNWDQLNFPPELLASLECLALRGFILDPVRFLTRLADSLCSLGKKTALKRVISHLAQDEQDATYAWRMLSQYTDLTSLAFTLPVLFDARYAERLVKAFPALEELELFAFTKAAAWRWPDPFEAYINAFSELKGLRTLSLNHNEEASVAQLHPTMPQPLAPGEPSLPVQTAMTLQTDTSLDVVATPVTLTDESMETEEVVEYGPFGGNFSASYPSEDDERRLEISDELFKAIPNLQKVRFKPDTRQHSSSDLFACRINEML